MSSLNLMVADTWHSTVMPTCANTHAHTHTHTHTPGIVKGVKYSLQDVYFEPVTELLMKEGTCNPTPNTGSS